MTMDTPQQTAHSRWETTAEAVGWVSLVMLLVSYALITLDYWTADNAWYQLLNLVGSAGIAWIAFAKKDSQPAILNAVWALIALYALLRAASLI